MYTGHDPLLSLFHCSLSFKTVNFKIIIITIIIIVIIGCECDVWYHRFVVQNSLLFTLCAQLYLFIDGVSVFMNKEMGVSDSSVSLGMIIFLGVLTVAWFPIESFVIPSYTMYTFASYIVTIFYLSSIMSCLLYTSPSPRDRG